MMTRKALIIPVLFVGLILCFSTPATALDLSKLAELEDLLAPGEGELQSGAEGLGFFDANNKLFMTTNETDPASDGFTNDGSAYASDETDWIAGAVKNGLNETQILEGRMMIHHTWDLMVNQPDIGNDLSGIFNPKTFYALYWFPDQDADVFAEAPGKGVLTDMTQPGDTFLALTFSFDGSFPGCGRRVKLELWFVNDGQFDTKHQLDMICMGLDRDYEKNWFYQGSSLEGEEQWRGYAWNIIPPSWQDPNGPDGIPDTGDEPIQGDPQLIFVLQYLESMFISSYSEILTPISVRTIQVKFDRDIEFTDNNAFGVETTKELIFDDIALGWGASRVSTISDVDDAWNDVIDDIRDDPTPIREIEGEIPASTTALVLITSGAMVATGGVTAFAPTIAETRWFKSVIMIGAGLAIIVFYVLL